MNDDLTVKQLLAEREQLEMDLLGFITSKFTEFREKTGITPTDLDIEVVSIESYLKREFAVSRVTVRLELER